MKTKSVYSMFAPEDFGAAKVLEKHLWRYNYIDNYLDGGEGKSPLPFMRMANVTVLLVSAEMLWGLHNGEPQSAGVMAALLSARQEGRLVTAMVRQVDLSDLEIFRVGEGEFECDVRRVDDVDAWATAISRRVAAVLKKRGDGDYTRGPE